jgi:hypothetical protein
VQKHLGEFVYDQDPTEDARIKIEAKPMKELKGSYIGKKL